MLFLIDIIFQSGDITNQSQVKGFLDYLFMVLPSILGICTLIIAYRVYRNQDAKKLFLKVQIELVIKIAESLEKTMLIFAIQESQTLNSVFGFNVSTINLILNEKRETHKDIFGKRLLVRNNFWEAELFSFTNNMFLPKIIKEEILKFQLNIKYTYNTYTKQQLELMSKVVIITVIKQKESLAADQQLEGGNNFSVHEISNPCFKDADEFLKSILRLKKIIINWLKDYNIEVNVENVK